MKNLSLILSIIASIVSIIGAIASFNFYKKALKIVTSYSHNNQISGNNSKQIIGEKNKVK